MSDQEKEKVSPMEEEVQSGEELNRSSGDLAVSVEIRSSEDLIQEVGKADAPGGQDLSSYSDLKNGLPKHSKVTRILDKVHKRVLSSGESSMRDSVESSSSELLYKNENFNRGKTTLNMRTVSLARDPEEGECTLQDREDGEFVWVEPQDSYDIQDIKDAQYIGDHINFASVFAHKLVYHDSFKFKKISIGLLIFLVSIFPTAVTCAWFALIPIHDPDGSYGDKASWVFVVNPLTWVLISYLIVTVFLACLDERVPWRPWHTWVHIPIMTYFVSVCTVGFSVFFHNSWPLNGIVSFFVTIVTTLLGLRLKNNVDFYCPRKHYLDTLWQFSKCMITVFIFTLVLACYVIGFSAAGGGILQSLLTFALMIFAFIFKKILLAQTDQFPLEAAMVIAGLWVENLDDIFTTMAYPSVDSPEITFIVLWFSKFFGNIWYLLFLTDYWFSFRVWIKAFFKGQKGVAIEEDDKNDRGHSNVRPAYHRRQVRFYMWKVLSQFCAQIFYICVGTCLRYSYNSKWFRFSDSVHELSEKSIITDNYDNVTEHDFRNSLIFSGINLTWIFFSGVFAYCMIKKYRRSVFDDLQGAFSNLIVSENYTGFVLTIVVSNMFMVCSFVMYQTRVFFV
eukprot:Nk52_evm2s598 gene=Nk52_evmTU2s598